MYIDYLKISKGVEFMLYLETLEKIRPLNYECQNLAKERLDLLLKPKGSLGRLEEIVIKLAGIRATTSFEKTFEKKAIIMMCADHGIFAEGYHLYPQGITKLIAELTLPQKVGGAILAKHAGADLVVVDVGIKESVQGVNIISRKVKDGTNNMTQGPAMSMVEAINAMEIGIEISSDLIDCGYTILGLGEVGICNTASSSAIMSVLTEISVEEATGMGSGCTAESYRRKVELIKQAIEVNLPNNKDPLDVLAKLGGLEIAALVGCCIGAAAKKTPIVLDGFITCVAALIAVRLNYFVSEYLIASHTSSEKGASKLLEILQLKPLLSLDLRLGEGTGAALAFNVIDAAQAIIMEMGSFQ